MNKYATEILLKYRRRIEELQTFEHPPDEIPTTFVVGDFSPRLGLTYEKALRNHLGRALSNETINTDWTGEAITEILKGAHIRDEMLPSLYALMFANRSQEVLVSNQELTEELLLRQEFYDAEPWIYHERLLESWREFWIQDALDCSDDPESVEAEIEAEIEEIQDMGLQQIYEKICEEEGEDLFDRDGLREEYLECEAHDLTSQYDLNHYDPYSITLTEYGSEPNVTPTTLIAYMGLLAALDLHQVENSNLPILEIQEKLYPTTGDLSSDPVISWCKDFISNSKDSVPHSKAFASALDMVGELADANLIYFPTKFSEVKELFRSIHSAVDDIGGVSVLKREGRNFIFYMNLCSKNLCELGLMNRSFTKDELRRSIRENSDGYTDDFWCFYRLLGHDVRYSGKLEADSRIPFLLWRFNPNQQEITVRAQQFDWEGVHDRIDDSQLIELVAISEFLKRVKNDPEQMKSLANLFISHNSFLDSYISRLENMKIQETEEATIHEINLRYYRALAFYRDFCRATLGDHVGPINRRYPKGEYTTRINFVLDQITSAEVQYQESLELWATSESYRLQQMSGPTANEDKVLPPEEKPTRNWGKLPMLFATPRLLVDFMVKRSRPIAGGDNQTPLEQADFADAREREWGTPDSVLYTIGYLDSALGLYFSNYPVEATDKISTVLAWITEENQRRQELEYPTMTTGGRYRAMQGYIGTIENYAENILAGLIPFQYEYQDSMKEVIKDAEQGDHAESYYGETDIGEDRVPVILQVSHHTHDLLPPYTPGQIEAIKKYGRPDEIATHEILRTPGSPLKGAEILLVTHKALATNFQAGVRRCFYPGELPFPPSRVLGMESGWLRQVCVQSARQVGDKRWEDWYAVYRKDLLNLGVAPTNWGDPDPRVFRLLHQALTLCFGGSDWNQTADKRAIAIDRLLDYLIWAMGDHQGVEPNWQEYPWKEHDQLHQIVSRLPLWMYLYPADYFGSFLSEEISVWGDLLTAIGSIEIDAGVQLGFFSDIEEDGKMTRALEESHQHSHAIATTNDPLYAKALFVSWLVYAPHLIYPFENERFFSSVERVSALLVDQHGDYLEQNEPHWEQSFLPVVVVKERSSLQIEEDKQSQSPPSTKPVGIGPTRPPVNRAATVNHGKTVAVGVNTSAGKPVASVNKGTSKSAAAPKTAQAKTSVPIKVNVPQSEPLGIPLGDLKALTRELEAVEIELRQPFEPKKYMEMDPNE